MEERFHDHLKKIMDEFVHLIYKETRNFPKEELYGLTSQIRRAALSIILNYIEGFARIKNGIKINFLEISYGSLKEVKYLLNFSLQEKYISELNYKKLLGYAEEIGAMLWTSIRGLKEN